ncbi:UDP-N-acetylmuramoylalanyl-D-glutamate--2,6-diaminopimelate ligase [Campylobacter mucosalis]|uniref:UDP-N-acetylmuramoyl-L-alanyl-D-glutamate--2, 6-diaminopimelate ligase n=1 Tax=Campylobacter mucosalis TaxID=202 RepID=UPI0004D5322B|nr:UDP-N-acetylmuramoyl-L-alanyl-D-glutamate--2,6-diaminopimelate ligase [Campylobacter mucosalis]KEA45287.1 UDP-N-acetylmuramoylalanyl-D-glutamate--2,6-diaminopimelate ligase [Campylobacter mucosalis]QKF63698.1 UDP-N-acetylmuramoylalanyl-D-glutamate 2,6-diaminopimelate ligase [Campylobacter mucosalis]
MKICIDDTFITDNSLECEPGCFFLLCDTNAKFKDDAILRKASIVNVDRAKELLGIDENLKIVGITGTNGKTTTAALLAHILNELGHKTALCGTRGAFIANERIDQKALTTSQILTTLWYMQKATLAKCEYLVMEVSSHAIVQNRIEGLSFALKIFTNISQDHLDYHKSMEEYARVKSSFFDDDTLKLINIDDELIKFNPKNSYTYSLKQSADFTPISYDLKFGINASISALGNVTNINSSLQGEFNLQNLLAALGAVTLLQKPEASKLSSAVKSFNGVEGRVEVVSTNPLVIVDFAHTPDGMQKVLNALRNLSLIVVFGAGGDRDRTKRAKMGAIAQKYARLSIVTSDNPRSENPQDIVDEICSGMDMSRFVLKEVDRREAIRIGLENLKDGEALVILGKGDEDYQEINGVKHHFSDKEVVCELLKERK